MLILSLDTSSVSASCALVEDGKTVAAGFLNAKITHSATLMPMIEELFKVSGRKPFDVSLLSATAGPGSFTGVRIGASILLGLAFGKNVPCVGVSTLETTAYPFNNAAFEDKLICPVMDARRGQFYNALFKNGKRVTDDRAISSEELYKELKAYKEPVILCGDGAELAAKLIDMPFITAPAQLMYPTAANAARLAYDIYESADDKSVFTDLNFKPVYLRPSQAERNLNNN